MDPPKGDMLLYLSIKLQSFVHYSPRDVHRIVDKLNNARYDYVCNPVDIPRITMHKRMQFNACIFLFFKTHIILKHRLFHSNFLL